MSGLMHWTSIPVLCHPEKNKYKGWVETMISSILWVHRINYLSFLDFRCKRHPCWISRKEKNTIRIHRNTWVPAKSRPSSLTARACTWPFGPLKLCCADVCTFHVCSRWNQMRNKENTVYKASYKMRTSLELLKCPNLAESEILEATWCREPANTCILWLIMFLKNVNVLSPLNLELLLNQRNSK